ncbi:MAG: glutaredoxin family protein [Thiobacillus sp.]
MNVKIIATKGCSHCLGLQHELRDMGIPFEVLLVEEHPDVVATHGIRHSPNILVNEEVVFRGQPSPHELRQFFGKV